MTRPRLPARKRRTKHVIFRIKPDEEKKLKALCKHYDLSISELLRKLLNEKEPS